MFRAPENLRAAGPPARTRNYLSPHWSCQSRQHHPGRPPAGRCGPSLLVSPAGG